MLQARLPFLGRASAVVAAVVTSSLPLEGCLHLLSSSGAACSAQAQELSCEIRVDEDAALVDAEDLELELELALCEDDFDFDEEDSSGCALYQVSECTVDGEVDSVLSASATEDETALAADSRCSDGFSERSATSTSTSSSCCC